MGRALNPAPTEPLAPARDKLAALVARRTDLTDMIGRETNRRKQAHDPFVAQQIDAVVRVLSRHLKNIEAEIARQIESDETLARQSSCLRSMPGVGPVVAAHLLAGLPELGRLDRRAIASLAGFAPLAKDSGLTRGKRSIWGGRAPLRLAIYLGAFIASRHDATLRTFRHRLQSAGKPVKVAITACARKLLTILNAILREGADYRRPAV
nr:transposase [Paracoccus saliphilus]